MGWTCSQCREEVDDGFEVCWNCGSSVDGTPDPEFKRVSESAEQPAENAEWVERPPQTPARRACPDCRGDMRPIRLVDNTGRDRRHEPLRYAAGDAEQGLFWGRYPLAGEVEAVTCVGCGRIVLYGRRGEG